ncbi:MAG: zinc ribbon domain-containing protein [Candidatus Hodarchaeales archaeon]
MQTRLEYVAQRFSIVLGVVFLLIGFSDIYDLGTGVVLAMVSWITAWTFSNFDNTVTRDQIHKYIRPKIYKYKRSGLTHRQKKTNTKDGSPIQCPSCSSLIDPGNIFCPICGHQID